MTLRHMKIFRAICEHEYNSTKAAEALHMTQPAVSLAVKELEDYYGVRLFDRIGRRLQITEAGKTFLQYAIHISDLFSDMETGLRDWHHHWFAVLAELCQSLFENLSRARYPGRDRAVGTTGTETVDERAGSSVGRRGLLLSAHCLRSLYGGYSERDMCGGKRLETGTSHLVGRISESTVSLAGKGERYPGSL